MPANFRVRAVLALVAPAFALACAGEGTPTELPDPLVRSVQMQVDSTAVSMGQTTQLTASVTADAGYSGTTAILWRTSNPVVASVSDAGAVTGRSPGVVTVTARAAADTTIMRTAKVSVSGFMLTRVSAAGGHTCGLTGDGTAYCWGENSHGELGRGSVSVGESVPAPVAGAVKFTELAAAAGGATRHMCAISVAGDAWCWGFNDYGALGDGTTNSSSVPVIVPGGLKFRTIAVGGATTCGVTTDDHGYCWGLGTVGQIGNHRRDNALSPVNIMPGTRLQSIATADFHTCALAVGGVVHCWGAGGYGELGNGGTVGSPSPAQVMSSQAFTALDLERASSCALAVDGAVYCWGEIVGVPTLTPTRVRPDHTFAEIAGGGWLTCGRKTEGEVYCWGPLAGPQLGQGTSPVIGAPVAGGLKFKSISVGSELWQMTSQYACGTTDLGAVCWGMNTNGSLGTVSSSYAAVPTGVQLP